MRLRSLEREGEHQRSRTLFGAGCIWSWSQRPFSHKCSGLHSLSDGGAVAARSTLSCTARWPVPTAWAVNPEKATQCSRCFCINSVELRFLEWTRPHLCNHSCNHPSQSRTYNLFPLRSGSNNGSNLPHWNQKAPKGPWPAESPRGLWHSGGLSLCHRHTQGTALLPGTRFLCSLPLVGLLGCWFSAGTWKWEYSLNLILNSLVYFLNLCF